jgi:hypothetical protein
MTDYILPQDQSISAADCLRLLEMIKAGKVDEFDLKNEINAKTPPDKMKKLKLVCYHYRGARAGDDEGYELYVNGKQFVFPSGATRGRTKGEILEAFITSQGYSLEKTHKNN